MKKIYNKFLSAAIFFVGATTLTGCIDETEPTDVATVDQIAQSSAATEAIALAMPAYFNHTTDSWIDMGHCYFGYPAIMHIRDIMTGDACHNQSSYSHWRAWEENFYLGQDGSRAQYVWNFYYGFIQSANNTIGAVPDEEGAIASVLGYKGAGYAFRALAYLDLAQMYEWLPNDQTSSTNADGNNIAGLTVPIVTESMSEADARENPRASHDDMAAFILSDLDNAERLIPNLTNTNGNTLPTLAAVYGLKARYYLWLENYSKAQEYARKAINETSTNVLTQAQALDPIAGFNTASQFMWASQLTKEDRAVTSGIINWASWLTNQTTFGYTGGATGLYVEIDRNLYDRIGDTDWRKLEFKGPDGSPLNSQISYLNASDANDLPAYASVKFRPGQGNTSDYATGASVAIPIMRVEEMYFIEAEAAAHQNAAQGLELLTSFMQNYRNPQYSTKAATVDEVVDEIIAQKRIELWCEGVVFFDFKRLNMSVTRGYAGSNHYDLTRFNTNGRPAWMNFVIVQTEGNNNSAVKGYNNPDPSDAYTPVTE